MRKLLFLLSVSLLLVGCNDVDEFGQMLPDSVTLDEVRSVSDLTYEELETLVPDESQREEMRRNGGLLLKPTVVTSLSNQTYNDMVAYYSASESGLPPFNQGYWDILTGAQSAYYSDDDFICVSWYDDEQRRLLPGQTIYCMVGVGLWGGEQKPGFVDKIQDDGYYGSDEIFSEVRSYAYPDAPLISDFDIYEGDFIQASFRIVMPSASNEMPECGLCYSVTNQLPTVDADAVVNADENYSDGMSYNVDAIIQAVAGTYYVRAFVRGENGDVSYSPVRRASCQGLIASVQIDSLRYIADIPYNALASYTQIDDESTLDDLRIRGGALIFESASVEGDVYSWDMGLSVSATGVANLPNYGYENGYGAEPLWKNEDGNNNYWVIYWQPASYFAYATDRNDFHYQAAIGVSGASGNTLWSYSDTLATVWDEEPVIEAVYYSGGNPLAVSMDLTSWGHTTYVGVCYSTTNDLPTLEQCDGVAQCPDTSFGYNVNLSYEFTLPAGTYYVRAYAQSEGGLTYSPVQQLTITEDMTR